VKDYNKIAEIITRIHPTMYRAIPTKLGVCIFLLKQCDPNMATAFLEGHNFLRTQGTLKFHTNEKDGVICIR